MVLYPVFLPVQYLAVWEEQSQKGKAENHSLRAHTLSIIKVDIQGSSILGKDCKTGLKERRV